MNISLNQQYWKEYEETQKRYTYDQKNKRNNYAIGTMCKN